MRNIHAVVRGILDIIYPRICLACRRQRVIGPAENYICGRCDSAIVRSVPPFCARCGRHHLRLLPDNNICPDCEKDKLFFDRAWSPYVYTGVIRELIHEFKYKGKDYLGLTLSAGMIEFLREYNIANTGFDCIVPVPLHPVRLREREFNQAEVLARHIGKEFGIPVVPKALLRRRLTRTQTGLNEDMRRLNVERCFSPGKTTAVWGKRILLVDDVLTTGSTASDAARSLKESGASLVWVLTLAH